MNKNIIAIGGGHVHLLETLAIDKEIIRLSKKKHPRLLFVPTASSDSEKYVREITKVYDKKLGCKVDCLLLLRDRPNKTVIREKILSADIIYVGGGNTLKMMKLWRKLGVDTLLRTAHNKGAVLCGVSAGAICWFEFGHSDSMSFYHPHNWDYIRVKCLGFFKGLLCPHFNGQTKGIKRKKSFSQMIEKVGGQGIAIDNSAAIVIRNNSFRVINSKPNAKAYKLWKKDGRIATASIEPQKEFSPIRDLYSKTV